MGSQDPNRTDWIDLAHFFVYFPYTRRQEAQTPKTLAVTMVMVMTALRILLFLFSQASESRPETLAKSGSHD